MTSWAVRIGNYSELTRQRAPIGWLLLLFPTLTSLVVTGTGWPSVQTLLVFTLGVWLTRSAGCVINDYADRRFDAGVARTQHRPLAEGRVTPGEAIGLFLVLMALAALLLLLITPAAALTAVLAVPLIVLYPFAKRVTSFPQFVLGIAFSWGILVASVEMVGRISEAALWLFVANFFWILAYDTFYALQDLLDDYKMEVRSLATLLGVRGSLGLIAVCQMGMLIALVGLGLRLEYTWHYYPFLICMAALFGYQHLRLGKEENRASMGYLRAFRHNLWVGVLMLLAVCVQKSLL